MSIPQHMIPDSPETVRRKHITVMQHPDWWPCWPRLPLTKPGASVGGEDLSGFAFVVPTGNNQIVRVFESVTMYSAVDEQTGRDVTPAELFDAGWRIN